MVVAEGRGIKETNTAERLIFKAQQQGVGVAIFDGKGNLLRLQVDCFISQKALEPEKLAKFSFGRFASGGAAICLSFQGNNRFHPANGLPAG